AVPEPVAPGLPPDPSVEVVVVHEDDDVIVVDKPAGLVVHPGAGHASGTLAHGLLARYPELAGVGEPARPGTVPRLAAGTSARPPAAHASLVDQLSSRSVVREYDVLVWGAFETDDGVVDAPIGRSAREPTRMAVRQDGRPARTAYHVSARWSEPRPLARLVCR